MSATTAETLTGLIPQSLVEEVFSGPLAVPYPTIADRQRWDAADQADADDVIATAERFLTEPWPVLRAQDYARFDQDGDRATYEEQCFHRRARTIAFTLAACLTGDQRWVVEAVDGLWMILEETTWTVPAHAWAVRGRPGGLPSEDDLDLDLFCAETGATVAWISYLLGDALDEVSPLVRERIQAQVRRRVIDPFLTRRDWHWLQSPVNNWNPWIHSNVLASAFLVDLEPAVRQQVVNRTIEGLDQFIADTPADGGCDEGATYWGRAGGSLSDCLWLLHDVSAGRLNGFDHPTVIGTARYLPIVHIGGPYVVNFADGQGKLEDQSTVYPLVRIGRHTGQPEVVQQAMAMKARDSYPLVRRLSSIGRLVGILLDLPEKGDGFPYLSDGHYPETEVCTARQQAGTSDGLFLAIKGGHNRESHNHNDVGSIVVAVDGRPLIVDIGVGTYTRKTFSRERYSIFSMQSAYHNLPMINGQQQQPGREFAARGWSADIAPESVTVSMDLAAAYGPEAKINSWRREGRLDRPNGGPATITLTDAWELTGAPDSLVWHLILSESVEVDGDRVLVGNAGTRRLAIATDPALAVTVEEVPLEDPRMQQVWGDRLHRLVLAAKPDQLAVTGVVRTLCTIAD
jgi:hypothetical protein